LKEKFARGRGTPLALSPIPLALSPRNFNRGVREGLAQLLMEDGHCLIDSCKAFAGPDILEIVPSEPRELQTWTVAFVRESIPAASTAAEPCRVSKKGDLMLLLGDVVMS